MIYRCQPNPILAFSIISNVIRHARQIIDKIFYSSFFLALNVIFSAPSPALATQLESSKLTSFFINHQNELQQCQTEFHL